MFIPMQAIKLRESFGLIPAINMWLLTEPGGCGSLVRETVPVLKDCCYTRSSRFRVNSSSTLPVFSVEAGSNSST